ncbi:MAG: ATP-binding cassette domain-containing protein [Eubacteriales bacterium]
MAAGEELSLLEVDPGALERAFSTLSPGERTKVLLAALFSRGRRFLLIDEPTNHLDMEARRRELYLGGKREFILVSHDRAFLDELRRPYPLDQPRGHQCRTLSRAGKKTAGGRIARASGKRTPLTRNYKPAGGGAAHRGMGQSPGTRKDRRGRCRGRADRGAIGAQSRA